MTVAVTGCGGGGDEDSAAANTAPVASFVATPSAGIAELVVALDASSSRDADGSIASYSWNFGDSSAAGSGITVSHVYTQPGEYRVTLTVTDDRRATGSTSRTVTVRAVTAATRYKLTFIPFPGATYEFLNPFAINDAGQIVGEISSARSTAFLSSGGITRGLGTLDGDSVALDVNADGSAAGYSFNASGNQRAVLFDNGAVIDLGTLAGNSAAVAINKSRKAVGGAVNAAGQLRAVVFENGQVTDLGTLGGVQAAAYAVNDAGQAAGESQTGSGMFHAFLYRDGRMEDLGTLGGDNSSAYAINSPGQVLGASAANSVTGEPGYPYLVGFVYLNGVKTEIRPARAADVYPAAINDLGQVVGAIGDTADFGGYPFVWHPSNGMRNLNDLLDPAVGCRLENTRDVNNKGQIVGIATCVSGRYEWGDAAVGVLLTPES